MVTAAFLVSVESELVQRLVELCEDEDQDDVHEGTENDRRQDQSIDA